MSGIIINKSMRRAVIRVTANTTITLANLATSNTETVDAVGITQVFWAVGSNSSIARGANVVLSFPQTTAGHHNFMGHGIALNEFSSANLVFTLPDATSFMVVEVSKQTHNIPTEY